MANNILRLARSFSSVSIAVFLSRILGLVREQVLAGLFGAGTQMDAFVVAFRIPNLLRDLLAEGALSSAFVTVFSEFDEKRPRHETLELVTCTFFAFATILSIIVLTGLFFSRELVLLMAPDFSKIEGKVALTVTLTRIMFPFILMVSMASLFMGILNVRRHFFIPSLASAMFNLSSIIIGGGLSLLLPQYGYEAITGMAIGTLLGGASQMAIQTPLLKKEGISLFACLSPALLRNMFFHPGVKRIMLLMLPAVIGMSATQINIFINTNFASQCMEGSVAWLNYAFRLILFPIGVFGVAISIASTPDFAKRAAQNNMSAFSVALVDSLGLSMTLGVPASFGLWVMAEPIVRLIFEHGAFSQLDTLMTAQAVRLYAIGLAAYSAVKIIVPAFYAIKDTKWPVAVSFASVVLNILIILTTINELQHKAIALSTSITVMINFFILAVVLYKKIGGYDVKGLIMEFFKIAVSSLIMTAVIKSILIWFSADALTKIGLFLYVAGLIIAGVLSYGICGYAFKIGAIKNVFSLFSP